MNNKPFEGNFYSKEKPEYILCAAIHFDDGIAREQQPYNVSTGFVISGRRHHNCFATAFLLHGHTEYLKHEKEQGFLTSKDRFVTREEAASIAMEQGQVKPEHMHKRMMLFSEDLY